VPLLVFGALVALSALVVNDGWWWRLGYWVIAGPVGFLLIALVYHRRRLQVGVGAGQGSYAMAGLLVLVAFVLVLPLSLASVPTIAAALLVLAVRQRNAFLAVCAVCLGVVGGLEAFDVFDNLLFRAADHLGWFRSEDGYFNGASAIVYGLAGLLLLSAGLAALARERGVGRDQPGRAPRA
jgi:hypothetical protein